MLDMQDTWQLFAVDGDDYKDVLVFHNIKTAFALCFPVLSS